MKAMANSNGSGFAQASEINRARSSIGAVRIFYFFGAGFLSRTGQGDREADASKRWFIQYNSGRTSNIGDITKKALEAGCTVALYVNLRFLRRGPDPGQTGRQ